MNNIPQKRILAHEIGLHRIAMVVNQFHSQIQAHPKLEDPFGVVGEWGDHRARLTYFWWVALGGKPLRDINFDMFPKHTRAGFDADLFRDWMTLFRQAALSVVGKELTAAWMEKVEGLGRRLLIANDKYLTKLAKAS